MTRDMTFRQFRKACAQQGLRIEGLWLWDDSTARGYGMVMTRRRGQWKIDRRLSLAEALRKRREAQAVQP